MDSRPPIGKKLRFEVFKRDGFTCVYCGAQPPGVILHVDHVIPRANGGSDDIDNLVTACDGCNLGKGARELTAIPISIEEKAAILEEREEQIAAFNALIMAKQVRIEETAWQVANVFLDHWNSDRIRTDWLHSIKRFVERLPLDELLEAASIGVGRAPHSPDRAFKYFCGVCWRKIRRTNGEDV
jgi:HNH endonuclease